MKKIIFSFLTLCSMLIGMAQGSETFDNLALVGSAYTGGTFVGDNDVTWTYADARNQDVYPIDGNGILFRNAANGFLEATLTGGVTNFSFQYRKAFTGGNARQVELIINGNVVATSLEFGAGSGEDTTVHTLSATGLNIEGTFTVKIKLTGTTTAARQIVVDNILWTGYEQTGPEPCDLLAITSTTPGSVCDAGTVTLGATAATENIYWYANQTGGESIGSGTSFTTPNLTETTSYWVSEYKLGDDTVQLTGLGKQTYNSGATGTSPSNPGWGLIFTASEAFTLNTVEVFSNGAGGNLVINLTDMNLTVLDTKTVLIPAGTTANPTPFVVNLDFEIDPGQYRLVAMGGSPSMIRDGTAATTYPYSLGTVGEIINGDLGDDPFESYYFFYNWSITIGSVECESDRVEVVATVNPTIDIQVANEMIEICDGSNANLVVSSANTNYVYTWMPGNLTGSTVVITPTENTVYTVTAVDSTTGCSAEATTYVKVVTVPGEITVESSSEEVCIDNIVTLNSSIPGTGDLTYDFNTAITGWTVIDNSSTAAVGWNLVSSPTINISSNDNSQFYLSNPDGGNSSTTVDSKLVSESFSLEYASEASLNFFHYFRYTTSTPARIDISIDGGLTYENLVTYTATVGAATSFFNENISLNDYLGQSNVKVRFNFTGGWGWYWAIDNVTIVRTSSGAMTWSPATNLYLDEAATTPYDGSAVDTVYHNSDVSGEFTYTATLTVGTCGSVSESVTIIVISGDAPQGDAEQSFTEGETIADLEVTATGELTWYDQDGNIIENTTTLVDGATYSVTQTINGCESEALEITVTLGLSTKNNAIAGFTVYPNPVHNTLFVKANTVLEQVVVYNNLGQVVLSKQINATDAEIDFANLPTGAYFVKATSEGKTSVNQLIKK